MKRSKIITFSTVLLLCLSASAQTHKKAIIRALEHLALGAGTEVGISQAAGGSHKYLPGIIAAGAVAAAKEGSDAYCGRDSRKTAAFHAFTILLGAGAAAAIKH